VAFNTSAAPRPARPIVVTPCLAWAFWRGQPLQRVAAAGIVDTCLEHLRYLRPAAQKRVTWTSFGKHLDARDRSTRLSQSPGGDALSRFDRVQSGRASFYA